MRDLNRVISVKEAAWVSPGLPWAEEEEGGQGRTQEGSRGQVSIDNLSIHHILIWSIYCYADLIYPQDGERDEGQAAEQEEVQREGPDEEDHQGPPGEED